MQHHISRTAIVDWTASGDPNGRAEVVRLTNSIRTRASCETERWTDLFPHAANNFSNIEEALGVQARQANKAFDL
jgi:hypothetical protein